MWIIRPNHKTCFINLNLILINYLFNILIVYFCLFKIVATANPHVSIYLLRYWKQAQKYGTS